MRGGRRPAEWAVFYSKPPSPICNRDLHNSRRPFTIVSRVLHFVESRPGGARRPAAPGDPAGAHGVLQIPDRWLPAPGRPRGGSTDAPQPGRQDPAQAPHRRIQGGRSITVEGTETQLPAIGVDVTRYWLRNVLPRISSTPGPGSCRTTGTSRSTASPTSVGPTTITLEPVSSRKRPRWPLTRAGTIQTPSPDSSGTRTSPSPADAAATRPGRPWPRGRSWTGARAAGSPGRRPRRRRAGRAWPAPARAG